MGAVTSVGTSLGKRINRVLDQKKEEGIKKAEIQRSAKVWKMLEDINWLKLEALKRLAEEMPHRSIKAIDLDSVEIVEIGTQSIEKHPIEEGDLVTWMHLVIYIDGVLAEQFSDLNHFGTVTILDVNMANHDPSTNPVPKYSIKYETSYGFTFWDGKVGKAILEDSFAKHS